MLLASPSGLFELQDSQIAPILLEAKLRANRLRDLRNQRALRKLEWAHFVVWECELSEEIVLADRLSRFLNQ